MAAFILIIVAMALFLAMISFTYSILADITRDEGCPAVLGAVLSIIIAAVYLVWRIFQ